MKKTLSSSLFIIMLLSGALHLHAQAQQDTTLKLQDISLSNAPAFSLLDISPSSIEHPATTKAFAVSVVNTFSKGNGIPQNYAMEFTPFWFIAHPRMTNYKYFGVKPDSSSNPFSQARFFSVSMALINEDSTTNIGKLANHNAGFGIRTTLVRLYKTRTRNRIGHVADQWYQNLRGISHVLQGEVPTQRLIDSISHLAVSYGDTMKVLLQTRPLFSLDLAAATNLAFPTNSFASNHVSRTGVWLNASLSVPLGKTDTSGHYFSLYAIGRYMHNSDSLDAKGNYVTANSLDYGLKTEFQLGRIALAYEYIRRTSSDKSVAATFKSVGLIHYKIRDGLFITGAFGQNFSTVHNLVSTIGINWGFSNGKEKIEAAPGQ